MSNEVTPTNWRRSSYSGGNGNCVEVAELGDVIALRDSKNPDGPRLTVGRHAWSALLCNLKHYGDKGDAQ
jgi:Domain of unknown function (DUF397).